MAPYSVKFLWHGWVNSGEISQSRRLRVTPQHEKPTCEGASRNGKLVELTRHHHDCTSLSFCCVCVFCFFCLVLFCGGKLEKLVCSRPFAHCHICKPRMYTCNAAFAQSHVSGPSTVNLHADQTNVPFWQSCQPPWVTGQKWGIKSTNKICWRNVLRVRLMTNSSSVSLVALMRKCCHLPSLPPSFLPCSVSLSLSHMHTHTHARTQTLCHSFESLLTWILLPVALSPGCPACLPLLDKLFGKRLLQARHYIMSRKSWLKMVPTENCDILMTFPGAVSSRLSSLLVCWWNPPSLNVFGTQPDLRLLIYCSRDSWVKYVYRGCNAAHCAGLFLRIANWKHFSTLTSLMDKFYNRVTYWVVFLFFVFFFFLEDSHFHIRICKPGGMFSKFI